MKSIKKNFLIMFILVSVIFGTFVGFSFSKSKLNEIIKERENEIIELKRKNDKIDFILKSVFIIKKHSKYLTDQEIYNISNTAWEEAFKYRLNPNILLASGFVESGFNNHYIGLKGEKTYLQFMPTTYNEISGEELTDDKVKDVVEITKQYFKLMALYTFTFYDNEKVFIAYNCGHKIFNYFDDIEKIKMFVYDNKNLSYYPERIKNKYIEYINYTFR
jgi:hypothetical protein